MKKLIISLSCAIGITAAMSAQSRLYANEFPLGDVIITEGPFRHAQNLNVEVLLAYDVDRLLAPYLKAASLDPRGESFGCWDGLDGHIGGHYLSALAIHYAATGNQALKDRMDYMLSQLAMCAVARGDGYVGGVPDGDALWQAIEAGDVGKIWDRWVPWYNVHKIYAGLRDCYVYAGSTVARNLFLGMCDWGLNIIANLDDAQMESMLDNEFGGMNEIYADAYAITGDRRYMDAARKFTHHQLFDPMRDGVDNLDNKHANTQVPKVVGFQRIAELTGDKDYERAAGFFWETVIRNRSLSIGGNSRREHFASQGDARSYVDDREGPESCNTNNMLKLTEGLFRMTPDASYADFYERALYNHILSTQHPEHGGYVYFTSARPGHYRVYSSPNSAMWCCVGTGMENHGKYAQFIYTHIGNDTLQVNLFIPSCLDWRDKGVTVVQDTKFPVEDVTRLRVKAPDGDRNFTLALRHPGWCDRPVVKINGKTVKTSSSPSSYIMINRKWSDGDEIEMSLPMKVTVEELNYLPNYISILRGPIVMGARLETDVPMPGLVADDSRWAHIAHGPLVSVFDTPLIIGKRGEIVKRLAKMTPIEGREMAFKAPGVFSGDKEVVLEPFYKIHDSRYMIYWLSMTRGEYDRYRENARRDEEARLRLDSRTVDAVNTGEQQPEADHFMESRSSTSGNFNGEPWRDASSGGYFSYKMRTGGNSELSLRLRFWGNESGSRTFDVYVDDTCVATVDPVGKWNVDEFVEEEYPLPSSLVANKDNVTVKFCSKDGNTAGGIFHVRLIKP